MEVLTHVNGRSPAAILYVATGATERVIVRDRLGRSGHAVVVAADLAQAVSLLSARRFTLCVIDLTDERTALSAVRLLRVQHPHQSLAGVMDPANPVAAGQAIDAGLVDLLPWPFEDRDLLILISNAQDRDGMDVEAPRGTTAADSLFAHAPAMRAVVELVRLAAGTRSGVSVCGEADTGRELVARTIHELGKRSPRAEFVRVDCAGDAWQDLERQLFGGISGRAGAAQKSGGPESVGLDGAIAQARRGTLYLTNLTEASARVQAKLARLLRDQEAITGDDREVIELDVRPIGAFEPGLDAALADGRLRRELIERLSPIRIEVPPLRRRRQDIPLLAAHFLDELCEQEGLPRRRFSRSAAALLTALPWHGNAGELKALLRTVLRSARRRTVIQLDDLLEHASLDGLAARIDTGVTLRDAKARFERECISAVLMRHHGRVGEAAKALGIQRTNLYRKVRQLNVARSLLSARK